MTEKQRSREKFLARVQAEREAREASKPRKRSRERIASREEQHARYIDCGPQAWDDQSRP